VKLAPGWPYAATVASFPLPMFQRGHRPSHARWDRRAGRMTTARRFEARIQIGFVVSAVRLRSGPTHEAVDCRGGLPAAFRGPWTSLARSHHARRWPTGRSPRARRHSRTLAFPFGDGSVQPASAVCPDRHSRPRRFPVASPPDGPARFGIVGSRQKAHDDCHGSSAVADAYERATDWHKKAPNRSTRLY